MRLADQLTGRLWNLISGCARFSLDEDDLIPLQGDVAPSQGTLRHLLSRMEEIRSQVSDLVDWRARSPEQATTDAVASQMSHRISSLRLAWSSCLTAPLGEEHQGWSAQVTSVWQVLESEVQQRWTGADLPWINATMPAVTMRVHTAITALSKGYPNELCNGGWESRIPHVTSEDYILDMHLPDLVVSIDAATDWIRRLLGLMEDVHRLHHHFAQALENHQPWSTRSSGS